MIEGLIESVLNWRYSNTKIDEQIAEGTWVIDINERRMLITLIDEAQGKLRDMKFYLRPFGEIKHPLEK